MNQTNNSSTTKSPVDPQASQAGRNPSHTTPGDVLSAQAANPSGMPPALQGIQNQTGATQTQPPQKGTGKSATPNIFDGFLGGFKLIFGKKGTSSQTTSVTPQRQTPTTAAQQAGKLPEGAFSEDGSLEMTLQDIIAPSSLEVDFNHVQIGDRFYRTLFSSGYPRFVGPN